MICDLTTVQFILQNRFHFLCILFSLYQNLLTCFITHERYPSRRHQLQTAWPEPFVQTLYPISFEDAGESMQNVVVHMPPAHGPHLHVLARNFKRECGCARNGASCWPNQECFYIAYLCLFEDFPVGFPQSVVGAVVGGSIRDYANQARGEASVELARPTLLQYFDKCIQQTIVDSSLRAKEMNGAEIDMNSVYEVD